VSSDKPPSVDGGSVEPQIDRRTTDQTRAEDYDPGETLGRAMNLGCTLVLIALALVSCGFIASVMSLHR
jgi:hypothetical protein